MPCLSVVTAYFYNMIKVFVIGTGNLGTQLCYALKSANYDEVSLVGYTNKSGRVLPKIKAPYKNLIPDCDLIIIAVPDDEISSVSSSITTKATVVHTSGSVPMNELERHENFGVFYIPQTFSIERLVDFSEITICLEFSNDVAKEQLKMVASTLSRKQKHINSTQRQQLHLAAVYMNNFVNHCYFKAQEILKTADLSTDLLEPLMQETFEKAKELTAYGAQTGPGRRGDNETIKRHLSQLKKQDQAMYIAISESIKKTYET